MFICPAITVSIAVVLFYLDKQWLRGSSRWDDLPLTTAQGLAALLLGSSPLIVAKLPTRLVGVAVSWTWLGFLLDRRLSGVREPIIRNTWVRAALDALGLALALVFAWEGSSLLRVSHVQLDYYWRCLKSSSPRRTLLGHELMTVAWFLWGIGFSGYFSAKLWRVCLSGKGRVTAGS